jgi:hypothetical protein
MPVDLLEGWDMAGTECESERKCEEVGDGEEVMSQPVFQLGTLVQPC